MEHIRTWEDPDGHGFRLELYDLHEHKPPNHNRLGYDFYHNDERIFWGKDYGCPQNVGVDSDEAVQNLLVFLSPRPGDTDSEYFSSYTPDQLAWCKQWGETLSLYGTPEGWDQGKPEE